MNEGFICSQCNRYSYRQRKTKDTCSGKCRTAKARGIEPKPYWEIDTTIDRYEQFMATALDQQPRLATRLQQIKERYGRNAMLAAIDAISIAVTGDGISI